MPDAPQIGWRRAAAYVACRDHEGRLLLARIREPGSRFHGWWTLPGGGMEWGEDPAATASREMAEETGLTPQLGPILGIHSAWFEADAVPWGEAGHVLGIVFEGTRPTGTLTPEAVGTTDAAEWFPPGALGRLDTVPLVDFAVDLLGTQ